MTHWLQAMPVLSDTEVIDGLVRWVMSLAKPPDWQRRAAGYIDSLKPATRRYILGTPEQERLTEWEGAVGDLLLSGSPPKRRRVESQGLGTTLCLENLSRATEANNVLRLPVGVQFYGPLLGRQAMVVTSEADLFCKTFIQLYQDQKVPRNSLTVIGSAGIGKSCTSVLLIYRLMKLEKPPVIVVHSQDDVFVLRMTGGTWTVQEEEDVPQEGAVAVYDTEQEIAANDVARKQHSAVFLAANQKNLPSSWLKMNGSTCWYMGPPTPDEIERMRALDDHFSNQGVTKELVEEMLLLVGRKPRLLLNQCTLEFHRTAMLKSIKAAILGTSAADIMQVSRSLTLTQAVSAPDSLFTLMPAPDHFECHACFASPWTAMLAAHALWAASKGSVLEELQRVASVKGLESYFGTLYKYHVLNLIARGIRAKYKELQAGNPQDLIALCRMAREHAAAGSSAGSAASSDGQQGDDGTDDLPPSDLEALRQQAEVTKVLSVACKLLGAESFPPMDAFETPARSLGAAQHVSTEEMQLGPFALLPGTKELEALTKNELLVLKHRNNPAIDAASGTGVMVQVTTALHHPLSMKHFNEQAKRLAQACGVEASDMILVWVVPPRIYQQFREQKWTTTRNKEVVQIQSFARCIRQVVVEVDIFDSHR